MKTHVVELTLPTPLPIKDSNQLQKVLLMHKANRSAKCHGQCCKANISVGSLCLKVKGLLTVPLSENDIIQQDFYFCPQKVCLSSMPVCSNVQYLHSVDAEADIAAMDLDIVVI